MRNHSIRLSSLGILMGAACFFFLTAAANGQGKKREVVKYSATLVGVRGSAGGMIQRVNIQIQNYTSDEQRDKYLDMIAENNPKLLRRTLEQVNDLGRISAMGYVGNELAVVRERDTEHGKLINLVGSSLLICNLTAECVPQEH